MIRLPALAPGMSCADSIERRAVLVADTPSRYCLATREVRAREGYWTGFGGLEIGKRYVSVHLMPVYIHPELLDGVSPALRRRMQVESCFNFRQADPDLRGLNWRPSSERCASAFTGEGRLATDTP